MTVLAAGIQSEPDVAFAEAWGRSSGLCVESGALARGAVDQSIEG